MGATPITAARSGPTKRSDQLDITLRISRLHRIDGRVADFSLAVYKRTCQCLGRFRPIRRWLLGRWLLWWRRLFGRRRFFRRWRIIRWRWRFRELVMEISKEDQGRITKAIRAAEAK